jgi:hypothetical protein
MFVFIACVFEVLSQKSLPKPMFYSTNLIVSIFTFMILFHFGQFVFSRSVSFLCMWIFSFSSSSFRRDFPFSNECSCLLCQNSVGYKHMNLFPVKFYSYILCLCEWGCFLFLMNFIIVV